MTTWPTDRADACTFDRSMRLFACALRLACVAAVVGLWALNGGMK